MRSIKSKSVGIHAALLSGAVLASSAATARAELVAYWQFEPDNFLADSSGNGHTLANNGATSVTDVAGPQGGAGSALFDGTDIMQTVSTLDLSGYQSVTVTWLQRVNTTSLGVLFEHSPNKNSNPGGFLADVNELAPGIGFPDYTGAGGQNWGDQMPHDIPTGAEPVADWEQFILVVDLTATDDGVVEVTPGSDQTQGDETFIVPFRNDTWFIGARGAGTQFGYAGNIDELRIEGTPIPEPTGLAVLAALGGASALRRRRRA